jgi:hypothetical protein
VAQTSSEDPAIGLRAVASLRAPSEAVEETQIRRAREPRTLRLIETPHEIPHRDPETLQAQLPTSP